MHLRARIALRFCLVEHALLLLLPIRQRKLVNRMYTKIHIERGTAQPSAFVADITDLCDRLQSPNNAAASHAAYGEMHVCYSAWGISCQFGRRLLQYPAEFKGLKVTHVSIRVAYTPTAAPGVYRRRRATAVVEKQVYTNGSKPPYYTIDIDAESLAGANRLLDDIFDGSVQPTTPYEN